MIRGTTPTHRFRLPFDSADVDEARVIYNQFGKTVLRKTTEDFKMEGNWISVTLSQKDTFLFEDEPVTYQLRVKTLDGKVVATKPKTITVWECLDDEVI